MRKLSLAIALGLLLSGCATHPVAPAANASPAGPLPTPLAEPPDAPPQIVAVQISNPVIHGGETVTGTVVTSTNVSDVRVEFAGHQAALPQTGPGVFSISYAVPNVPFFLRGTYTGEVVARNAAGASAQRAVSVTIR